MTPTQHPAGSIGTLLERLIDYAGLFPPAQLSLEEAIHLYSSYRRSPDAWMLGTFVIPARRLSELAEHSGLFYTHPPFRFTLTGRGGSSMGEFLTGADQDLMDARRFLEIHGPNVQITGYEVLLTDDVLDGISSRRMGDILAGMVDRFESSLSARPRIFIESSWLEKWRERLNALIPELSRLNRSREQDSALGFKLRCGGVEPGDVPPSEIVAAGIHAAARADLPVKFTAGLEHPFRHHMKEFGGDVHGFINVFLAGALARVHKIEEPKIRQILDENDPEAFVLSETEAGWKGLRLPVESLKEIRKTFVTAYGSCSFDEPREDLRALQLLPGENE